MSRAPRGCVWALAGSLAASSWSAGALGQAPGNAAFPPDPPAAAPTLTPAPAPADAPAPAGGVAPTAGAAPATTFAPSAVAPAPNAAQAPAPARAPNAPAQPAPSRQAAGAPPEPAYVEPPLPAPPPPQKPAGGLPPISVRVDPFNWILEGRLGVELEVGILPWLTVETIPLFITDGSPPLMNYSSYEVSLSQHSGGLGPLAGATLGLNFWLSGKAFRGYAIRTGLTNYALEYESKTEGGERVDFVAHTERQLFVLLGSVNRWGAFTLTGGIGLGYELNQQERCYASADRDVGRPSQSGCEELQLATRDPVNLGPVAVVTPFTYPWEILARFSLGVTFD